MINGRSRRRRGGCDTAVTPGRGRNARQLIRRRLVLDTCRDDGGWRPARGGWLDNGRSRSGGCDTAVRQCRGRNALQRIRFVVRRLVLDTCRDNGGCRARARGGWLNDAGDEFFPGGKDWGGKGIKRKQVDRYDDEVGYQARPGTIGQNIKLVKTIGGTRLRI